MPFYRTSPYPLTRIAGVLAFALSATAVTAATAATLTEPPGDAMLFAHYVMADLPADEVLPADTAAAASTAVSAAASTTMPTATTTAASISSITQATDTAIAITTGAVPAQPRIGLQSALSPSTAATMPAEQVATLGTPLDTSLLDDQRGGSDLGPAQPLSGILTTGVVGDNRAVDVATGSNAIRDGAFTNASGIPVVIQNTGANVLIQNATIVNLQLH